MNTRRRHLAPLPATLRMRGDRALPDDGGDVPILPRSGSSRYDHAVSDGATHSDRDGVLAFAVIDAYSDIVLRTGTEREWRQSREAAARDGEPGIIDDFDGRAVYVEDWRC